MAMLIDLISCSHFLVATVFVNACRDIWWLSVECQQNIAQLAVKTCRNHQCGETKTFAAVSCRRRSPCTWFRQSGALGLLSDHDFNNSRLIKTNAMAACMSSDIETLQNVKETLSQIVFEIETCVYVCMYKYILYKWILINFTCMRVSEHSTYNLTFYKHDN